MIFSVIKKGISAFKKFFAAKNDADDVVPVANFKKEDYWDEKGVPYATAPQQTDSNPFVIEGLQIDDDYKPLLPETSDNIDQKLSKINFTSNFLGKFSEFLSIKNNSKEEVAAAEIAEIKGVSMANFDLEPQIESQKSTEITYIDDLQIDDDIISKDYSPEDIKSQKIVYSSLQSYLKDNNIPTQISPGLPDIDTIVESYVTSNNDSTIVAKTAEKSSPEPATIIAGTITAQPVVVNEKQVYHM